MHDIRRLVRRAAAGRRASLAARRSPAQDMDLTKPETYDKIMDGRRAARHGQAQEGRRPTRSACRPAISATPGSSSPPSPSATRPRCTRRSASSRSPTRRSTRPSRSSDIEDLISERRRRDPLLAGRREGDPAGAQEGGRQGHRRRSTPATTSCAIRGDRERLHRPVGLQRRRWRRAARQGPRRQGQDLRDAADRRHVRRGRPARRAEGRAEGPSRASSCSAPSTATGTAPRPSRSPRTCCSASRRSTACSRPPARCRSASPRRSRRPAGLTS